MARPTCIALLLAVPAVAVAGCGGNDDSTSKASAQRGVSGQQGTTSPQTGTSGETGARGARPRQASGKKRGTDRSGAESTAPAAATTVPSTPGETGGATSLTPAQLKQVGHQLSKQAHFLCKASTLQGLAQQYGIKSANPDQVAKAYAAPYLVGLRHAVAAGCKAGLLESK
jgi:hypothetical protein